MNSARLLSTAAIFGVAAFIVFAGISLLAWRLFPYPSGSDDLAQTRIWLFHVLAEKVAGILIGCAVAFLAARRYRPSWKIGVLTGVLAAIGFQITAIVVYLFRFGPGAYSRYHGFFDTILSTIGFGVLFAFFAVWKDYRRAHQ